MRQRRGHKLRLCDRSFFLWEQDTEKKDTAPLHDLKSPARAQHSSICDSSMQSGNAHARGLWGFPRCLSVPGEGTKAPRLPFLFLLSSVSKTSTSRILDISDSTYNIPSRTESNDIVSVNAVSLSYRNCLVSLHTFKCISGMGRVTNIPRQLYSPIFQA